MDHHILMKIALLFVAWNLVNISGDKIATFSCIAGDNENTMVLQFKLLKNEDSVHSVAVYSSYEDNPISASEKRNCVVLGLGEVTDPFHVEVVIDYSMPITGSNGGKCGISEIIPRHSYRIRVKSQAEAIPDGKRDVFYEFSCDKNDLKEIASRLLPIPADEEMLSYMKEIKQGLTLRVLDSTTRLPVTEVEPGADVVLETVFYPLPSSNEFTTKGRDFWIGALESGIDSLSEITLYLMSASSFKADVTLYSHTGVLEPSDSSRTVDPGSYFIDTINLEPHQSEEQTRSKTIRIMSSEDIYVMVGHKEGDSESVFTVLPSKSLGTNYYSIPGFWYGNFLIVATKQFTNVTIEARGDILLPDGLLSRNESRSFTLQEFESIHGSADYGHFLHGTRITSDKDIAVFVGGRADDGTRQTDHTSEQLIPTVKLGKRFIIPSSRGRVHCVAVQNSTELRHLQTSEILNEQEYFIKTRNSYSSQFFSIVSNASMQCTIEYGVKYDAMTMAPPITQWSSSYTFYVDPDKYEYILKLAVLDGMENGIQMYGSGYQSFVSLSSISWTYVLKAESTEPDYLGGTYIIDSQTFGPVIKLFHLSSKFMAVLLLDDTEDDVITATTVPGFNLPLLNSGNICQPSLGYPGDLIDNNCDEKIDEDLYNNENGETNGIIDPDGTLYDKLNIIGVRPYSVHAMADLNRRNDFELMIDENGCLPDSEGHVYFRPSSTFSITNETNRYPITYRSGTFKISRINSSDRIYFKCQIEFCLNIESSCIQNICQPSNVNNNDTDSGAYLRTEIVTSIFVKDKEEITDTPTTPDINTGFLTNDKSGMEIFKLWIVIGVLAFLLLASLATIMYLYIRLSDIDSRKIRKEKSLPINGQINGSYK